MTDEQQEAKMIRQGVDARIRRLRLMIDRIEGDAYAALDRAEKGEGRYSAVGEAFIKELTWGTANVGVEQIVYACTTADVYRAEDKLTKKLEGK